MSGYDDFSQKYGNFHVPSFRVSVEGEDVVKKYNVDLISITFEDAVDVSHRFSITFNDQRLPTSQYKIVDSGLFDPGKMVELKMGYLDKLSTMILGEITTLRPTFPSSGTPQAEASGYDLFYQLTRNRNNKTWLSKRDSEVVEEIIKGDKVKQKLTPHIERTDVTLDTIVQNGETDYAFIKKLAERNFFEFSIKEKNVYFGPPQKNTNSVITLEYGKSLLSFTPELNTSNQVSEVTVKGWDPNTKKEITGKAKQQSGGGQSGGETMAKLYGTVEQTVTDQPVYNQQQADILAQSLFNKLSVGLVQGTAECIGIPEIRAGTCVTLQGLGKKFSQKYFVERTTHTIDGSGYKTSLSVRGDVI